MSQRYLDKMSARIYAGASNLTRLWNAKVNLVGTGAFDVKLDLQLATMVSVEFEVAAFQTDTCPGMYRKDIISE